MELSKVGNKEFAFRCLTMLIEHDCIQEDDLAMLTDAAECKKRFSSNYFPVLNEVSVYGELTDDDCCDDRGRQRYYRKKFIIRRRAFVVTNHWYGAGKSMPDNRMPFMEWVMGKIVTIHRPVKSTVQ